MPLPDVTPWCMSRELVLREGQRKPLLDRHRHVCIKREEADRVLYPSMPMPLSLTFRPRPTAGKARPHGVDPFQGRRAEGRRAPGGEVRDGAGLARGADRGAKSMLSLANARGGLVRSLCGLHWTTSELLADDVSQIIPDRTLKEDATCPGPRQRLYMGLEKCVEP